MWYFSKVTKTDAENGFWRSTGEACEIYSTSTIIGLRKTLRFYEGRAPAGQKTNWMMQEYTTTEKYSSNLVCTLFYIPNAPIVKHIPSYLYI